MSTERAVETAATAVGVPARSCGSHVSGRCAPPYEPMGAAAGRDRQRERGLVESVS